MIWVPITIPEHQKPQTELYKPDCASPKDHDEADLCEQRRMAKAAEDALTVARDQYWIALWALGGLFATFLASAAAAWAAARAAWAAEASVAVAREMGVVQTRAYLVVTRGEIIYTDGSPPSVAIWVKNTGKSPAFNVTVVYKSGREHEFSEVPMGTIGTVKMHPPTRTVGAESEQRLFIRWVDDKPTAADNLANYIPLTNISGIIEYQTVFSRQEKQVDRDTAFLFHSGVNITNIRVGMGRPYEMELRPDFTPGWITYYRSVVGTRVTIEREDEGQSDV